MAEWYQGDPLDWLLGSDDVLEQIARARPEWHRRAACRGQGTDLWFPERGQPTAPAKEVCEECPVRAECAAAASDALTVGIWGGLSHRERTQRRRAA